MEEIKNQGTVGQEMTNKEPSMPQRLAPGETSTTTQPERLSGETYTYTHYKNTVTLASETRIYNQAIQDYSYDYAYDETIVVHLDHSSDVTVDNIKELLTGAALETVGGTETIYLEDNSSFCREYTGGYVLSTYDSEGWLIGRTTKEVRDGNNIVIASDGDGGTGNHNDSLYTLTYDGSNERYEIRKLDGTLIGYSPKTTEEKISEFLQLLGQGISFTAGVHLGIQHFHNPNYLSSVRSWLVEKYPASFISKINWSSALSCVKWGIRGFVAYTVIDAAFYIYTYCFEDEPRSLTDIIIHALFGEDEANSGTTNNGSQGGSSGGGSSSGGGYNGGVGYYTYQYPNENSGITIDTTSSGTTSGVPVYTYNILEVMYQVNTSYYDPDYGWGVSATMHNVLFGSIFGMGSFIYDSENSVSNAIGVPNTIYGMSNVGRYSVHYQIIEKGSGAICDDIWKHFDFGDTLTTTPIG